MSQELVPDRSVALTAIVPLWGVLRVGYFGGLTAARPRRTAQMVGVSADQLEAAVPYVFALAAREMALGAGLLWAWRKGHSGAGWMAVVAASDALDALVLVLLSELGTLDERRARRVATSAGIGAAFEAATAVALARTGPTSHH